MEAIGIIPGSGQPHLVQRREPYVEAEDEIKIRIRRVGICGTDREEARGGRASPPEGQSDLVIGHEMFGEVVEVGTAVTRVRCGDYAVFTVRRPCGRCLPCALQRPDLCLTGDYRERGIKGLDGYQASFVVDREAYVVRVPPELEGLGVLCEPLSVAEKAINEAVRIQTARLPETESRPVWLYGRHCLVAGLGPIGLLAALILRLRGAVVYGLDVVDCDTVRPQWLQVIGGQYVDGRAVPPDKIDDAVGPVELIVEAAGVASLDFNLLDALDFNGLYVLTGIPNGDRPIDIPRARLMRQLVLRNQLMLGSVNAARDHFQMGVDDLVQAQARWSDHVLRLITHRHPHTDFPDALLHNPPGEIKAVLEWTTGTPP